MSDLIISSEDLNIRKQEEFVNAIFLMSQGYNKTEVVEKINISRPTLNKWSEFIQDLSEEMKFILIVDSISYVYENKVF